MKRLACIVPSIALLIMPLSASADHIGVYNDDMGTSCFVENPPQFPILASVYVVHIYTLGAEGSKFKVTDLGGMIQAAQVPLGGAVVIGNPYAGAEVAYGACYFGHFAPLRLDYFLLTPPDPNCGMSIRIQAHPTEATPIAADCSDVIKPASGGEFVFGPPNCTGCSANPTATTTWGGVKALYR